MLVDKFLIVWWLLQLSFLGRDRQEQFRGCRQTITRLSLAFSCWFAEFEELSRQKINELYRAHHGAAETEAEDTAEGR